MAKYLIQGSYTQDGLGGLLKDGGSKRRDAAKQALEGVGGTMESYYLAFGEHDFYLIAYIPDNVGATALSLFSNASGSITSSVVVLLEPEEVDRAVKMGVDYSPPGN